MARSLHQKEIGLRILILTRRLQEKTCATCLFLSSRFGVLLCCFMVNLASLVEMKLSRKVINMGELRMLASQDIPDGAGIRATVWKSEITRQLEQSGLDNHEFDGSSQGFLSRSEISHGEHPLSLGKSSVWNKFFQETEIVEQIDQDVMRTHPDINFFSGDSIMAKSNRVA